ncbi:regulatory protein YcgZ [Candidatus Pantoea multigeneris]|uniref:Two-component-system connector protein YcgZ n=1 Tax=Candidatus Pantoea multigeneris TaxID=2608357 RepID=A0ABX0RHI9_9GAMM|nr:regulatory protein YcgZ [Pantoea multigeneris]NIF23942.1 two-component-system connector protein YcgZ [Pantoea multigeneris]
MHQNEYTQNPSEAIQQYFSQASLPSQQETLGQIVVEILREGRSLNRKSLCTKLLRRLELAGSVEEEHHYHQLIGLLFDRQG